MIKNYPLVSVIVVTYNGENLSYDSQPYIANCLKSVRNLTYPNLEVVVIDNNSRDETKNYLNNVAGKKAEIFFNSKNIGFAAGYNMGIRKSRGEFVLCLNQDVILSDNFIQEAVQTLQKDDKIAAVQPKIRQWNTKNPVDEGDNKTIDTTGLLALKSRRFISRGQGQKDQGQFEKEEQVFGADGAAPVFRKRALEDAKIVFSRNKQEREEYFDEDFFMYKEDVDLAWRLNLYGWKTIYQPKCLAWHNRSSGEGAARSYFDIIKERRKIGRFSKYLSFKNHRLLLIKNEQLRSLIRHLSQFLTNEIGAWGYILFFESYTLSAAYNLIKQIPLAFQKRKIIMAKKRIGAEEIERWFE